MLSVNGEYKNYVAIDFSFGVYYENNRYYKEIGT